MDRHQDSALAVHDPQAVSRIPVLVIRISRCVAPVENRVRMRAQKNFPLRLFRLQPGDNVDAVALGVVVGDLNSFDQLQLPVDDLHDPGISLLVPGAAVDGGKLFYNLNLLTLRLGCPFACCGHYLLRISSVLAHVSLLLSR